MAVGIFRHLRILLLKQMVIDLRGVGSRWHTSGISIGQEGVRLRTLVNFMTMNRYLKILFATALIAMGGACAQDSGGSAPPVATVPPSGSGVNPTPPTSCPQGQVASVNNTCVPQAATAGSGVPLKLVSSAQLARMFFNSNPNNPQNVMIQINAASSADSVVITYTDGSLTRQAKFGTVHPLSGVSDNSLNKWYNDGTLGKLVWKGWFQDRYGAVILVIDKTTATGDGTPGAIVGGSVWFQNFNMYYPNNQLQGPEKMCWQITEGPYDCRSYLFGWDWNNMIITPTLALYPNNKGRDANMNYEKLGDFSGLNRSAAGL